jgi:hypothetical protein
MKLMLKILFLMKIVYNNASIIENHQNIIQSAYMAITIKILFS